MGIKILKKKKLDLNVKRGFIAILGTLIIFLGICIICVVTKKETVTKKEILYEYMCQSQANYVVHIIDNIVYEGNTMKEGIEYVRSLLDYLTVDFNLGFQGSEAAEVALSYQILGYVRGVKTMSGKSEEKWGKSYLLQREKNIAYTDMQWNEAIGVKLTLDEYEEFAMKANEITGMSISTDLVIYLDGNLTINTEYGELTTPVYSSVTIPINQSIFSITKDEDEQISDSIIDTRKVAVPIEYDKVITFSLLILLCITSIIVICITTESPTTMDKIQSKAYRLIKNNASRIIALNSRENYIYRQTFELTSMEDLIKISDERNKPIFYIKEDFELYEYLFEVLDGEDRYIYHLYSYTI